MPGPATRPYAQARLSTLFLRVPATDWASVLGGYKREFRVRGDGISRLNRAKTPTPVVAYAVAGPPTARVHYGPALMVLEGTYRQPVGAISPESIEAEGFTDIAGFRRYWMQRTQRPFRPLDEVHVYRVRPWYQLDRDDMGHLLLERLYGEYL